MSKEEVITSLNNDFYYDRVQDPVQGKSGLSSQLNHLLTREPGEYYILYEVTNPDRTDLAPQQSLIMVNTNDKPYSFWYCDLQGRAPSKAFKEAVAEFLHEKFGMDSSASANTIHNANSPAFSIIPVDSINTTPIVGTVKRAYEQVLFARDHMPREQSQPLLEASKAPEVAKTRSAGILGFFGHGHSKGPGKPPASTPPTAAP